MGLAMEENPLEMKQLFFNNLQLLGFDVVAMEATNHIPFNKNMFELPNKRGSEVVLHFLFEKLNPTMCREAFRDVWPILDKKREQGFRKTCSNWLSNIAQEEPDCHLPRINASLFMSPGGDKFYQLLMYFSGHVLQKILDTELASKAVSRLKFFNLSQQNVQLGDVMMKDLICSSARHRKNYFDVNQLTLKAGKTWKETADEYVKDYRKHNKEIRELDYDARDEDQRAVENSINRGSPTKKHGKMENLDPNFDPRTIQRAQRVQNVREMWKQLNDFERTEAAEREIIESIVERTINKYKIDAADIPFKVPDMLLRECEEEIRRRNVANNYQGGKLNLESVLQLWNLSLNLYLQKFKEVGMPKFDNDVEKLTSQVHVQQNYLQNACTLRTQMTARIPVMQASIESLREKLDNIMFKDESPSLTRMTSFGLELVKPSPQPNFSPSAAVTPAQPLEVPRSPDYVDTPQAATKITEEMRESVKTGPKQLFTGDIDLFAQRPKESGLPRPDSSKASSKTSSRQSSRPTSARSTASTRGSKKSTQSSVRSTPRKRDNEFPTVTSPRTMVENMSHSVGRLDISADSERSNVSSSLTLSERSEKSNRSVSSSSTAKASHLSRSFKSHSSGGMSARSHDSEIGRSPRHHGRRTPTDLLVDEIMGEGKILSPFNSGLEAFESRNVVNRTPELEEANKENMKPYSDLSLQQNTSNNCLNDATPVEDNDLIDQQTNDINDDLDNVDDDVLDKYMTSYHIGPSDDNMDYGNMKERSIGVTKTDDNEIETEKDGRKSGDGTDLEGVEFEEILGPELDEEYDNALNVSDSSHRSEEQVIVIDKSLHLSPKSTQVTCNQQRSEDTECFIEDEKFPSLETSPREAIVIDHSFHRTPGMKGQENAIYLNRSGILSQSLQLETVGRDQVTKDLLSKSLILERSPLTEEIRQMFEKALAETPPRAKAANFIDRHNSGRGAGSKRQIDVTSPVIAGFVDRTDSEDDLDLPNMDIESRQTGLSSALILQQGNMSWDLTENLEDIEMPDFDVDQDLEAEYDNDNNRDSSGEIADSDKDAGTEKNKVFDIPGVENIEDIDGFFLNKTPESLSRNQRRVMKTPTGVDDHDFLGSIEMPKFPEVEDEPLLISFTP